MRSSIRIKLFAVFIVLLLIFTLVFLATNTIFLEDMFVSGNKQKMIMIYDDIRKDISDATSLKTFLIEVSRDSGASITIISENMYIIESTSADNLFLNNRVPKEIAGLIHNLRGSTSNHIFRHVSIEQDSNHTRLMLIGKLPSNQFILMEKPLGIIEEASRLAVNFIVISSLLTLVIGFIIVYYLSGKLTKPIVKINSVAQQIADLNFDNELCIRSKDELGELGLSINNISEKLSIALNELNDANQKLKLDIEMERNLEKMRRKFVSSVSHELKTPISMIQGYADGLKHNIPKTAEDKDYYYDVIIDESKKMNSLIRDLLDLSSYESGNFKIHKTNFDIVELVKTTVEKFKNSFAEKMIKVGVETPESFFIQADKLRIEQVITNFISNALKNVVEDGNIDVSIKKSDKSFILSVFNKGDKIDSSEKDNIWISFYKLESNNGYVKAGTGLGLAIVKAIIELHNGKYGVENINDGVMFWVEIPTV